MYFILSKAKDKNLNIACTLKPFDSTVLPIRLSGCEMWGFENNDIIESVCVCVCVCVCVLCARCYPLKQPVFHDWFNKGRGMC